MSRLIMIKTNTCIYVNVFDLILSNTHRNCIYRSIFHFSIIQIGGEYRGFVDVVNVDGEI